MNKDQGFIQVKRTLYSIHSLVMVAQPASESYDFNFCFPVPSKLENDRVKLIPFEVDLGHLWHSENPTD